MHQTLCIDNRLRRRKGTEEECDRPEGAQTKTRQVIRGVSSHLLA